MPITFPSGLTKPSNVTALPGNFIRPAFEELYGFDTPQGPPPLFDDSLSFPTIQVFDTEAEFTDQADAPQYTIVHAKDTDKLYVWDGSGWVVFNNN
jgi:hypothetical protein